MEVKQRYMTRRDIFEYVKQQYGTVPDYPWNDWNAVLRNKDNGKWYGLIMEIERKKLEPESDERLVDVLNVKCDPLLIGSLRTVKGFYPAYHMNKDKWISIQLDVVSSDEIKNLIAMSYELIMPKKLKNRDEN